MLIHLLEPELYSCHSVIHSLIQCNILMNHVIDVSLHACALTLICHLHKWIFW